MEKIYLLWAQYKRKRFGNPLIRIYRDYEKALKDLKALEGAKKLTIKKFYITEMYITERTLFI